MTKEFGICGEIAAGDVTREISAIQTIASGSSGTLATITPPNGQRVRITYLASSTGESAMSVDIDGASVISGQTLLDGSQSAQPTSGFMISRSIAGTISHIQGGTDESIEIIKDAGTTGSDMYYAYEYLE